MEPLPGQGTAPPGRVPALFSDLPAPSRVPFKHALHSTGERAVVERVLAVGLSRPGEGSYCEGPRSRRQRPAELGAQVHGCRGPRERLCVHRCGMQWCSADAGLGPGHFPRFLLGCCRDESLGCFDFRFALKARAAVVAPSERQEGVEVTGTGSGLTQTRAHGHLNPFTAGQPGPSADCCVGRGLTWAGGSAVLLPLSERAGRGPVPAGLRGLMVNEVGVCSLVTLRASLGAP